MGLREKFAEQFGEEQTAALELAGMTHYEMNHLSRSSGAGYGSDPFRTALVFAIGFDCYRGEYARYHGIELDAEVVESWIMENVDLTKHDGAWDWVSQMAGVYTKFVTV